MEGGLGIKGENQGKNQSSVSAWAPQEGLSTSALLGGMVGGTGRMKPGQRTPPCEAALPGVWQRLLSESGRGRKSQALQECEHRLQAVGLQGGWVCLGLRGQEVEEEEAEGREGLRRCPGGGRMAWW